MHSLPDQNLQTVYSLPASILCQLYQRSDRRLVSHFKERHLSGVFRRFGLIKQCNQGLADRRVDRSVSRDGTDGNGRHAPQRLHVIRVLDDADVVLGGKVCLQLLHLLDIAAKKIDGAILHLVQCVYSRTACTSATNDKARVLLAGQTLITGVLQHKDHSEVICIAADEACGLLAGGRIDGDLWYDGIESADSFDLRADAIQQWGYILFQRNSHTRASEIRCANDVLNGRCIGSLDNGVVVW